LVLILLGLFSFFISCQSSEESSDITTVSSLPGNKLYEQNCISCHGKKGDLGVSGATDLGQSQKTLEEKITFIKLGSGDGIMQPYGKDNGGHLSDEEVEKVAAYVETLAK
jgi:mono/diheme cytochrome c family protein